MTREEKIQKLRAVLKGDRQALESLLPNDVLLFDKKKDGYHSMNTRFEGKVLSEDQLNSILTRHKGKHIIFKKAEGCEPIPGEPEDDYSS